MQAPSTKPEALGLLHFHKNHFSLFAITAFQGEIQ